MIDGDKRASSVKHREEDVVIPESRMVMGLHSKVLLLMLGAFLLSLSMPQMSLAQMAQADFEVDVDADFGFEIPTACPGVPSHSMFNWSLAGLG